MSEEKKADLIAFEKRIRSAPDPLSEARPRDYNEAGDAIALAFLLLAEENPDLLVRKEGDGADPSTELFDAAEKKWPGFNNWIGGATGFMVGWATNAVQAMHMLRLTPNPAIITISMPDE